MPSLALRTRQRCIGFFALLAACGSPLQAQNTKPLRAFKVAGSALAFSPDSQTLATGGFAQIRLWNTKTWKLLHTLKGHVASIETMAYSPQGQLLATACNPYKDGVEEGKPTPRALAVNVWDAKTGKLKRTLMGHTSVVTAVAFSADGTSLATGSADKTIKVWSLATGKLKYTIPAHRELVLALAYSPDSQTLASGSVLELKVWNARTGKLKRQLRAVDESVRALAYNGNTLISISQNGKIHRFNRTTGQLQRLLDTNTPLTNINLTSNGLFYARGSWSTGLEERAHSEITVHSALTGQTLFDVSFPGGFESLALSPDCKRLAVGGSNENGGGSVTLFSIK